MQKKAIIIICALAGCCTLHAQRTSTQQAIKVAEQYYSLLNQYSEAICNNGNEAAVASKLHDLFLHKTYRTNNNISEELVESDLVSSDNRKSVDDNLENYLSQIASFDYSDGFRRVTFHVKIDHKKSFVYGPTNNDTVLIYTDKTIVVDGLFEKSHPEVVTSVKGKIVRVGTPRYVALFENTVKNLLKNGKYNDAYAHLSTMLEKGWVFHELYDGLAECLFNLDYTLRAPTADAALDNFSMMKTVSEALWNNSLKMGYSDISFGGIEELSATMGLNSNCYSYLSLLGCPDGQTASDGLIVFRKGNLQGYLNTNGDTVIHAQFRHAQRFEQHLAAAMYNEGNVKEGKYGLIDRRGEWIIKPTYDLIYSMPHYKAYVIRKGNKYGAMGYDGKVLVKPRYDKPVIFLHDDFATCNRGGKWGIVNREGDEVVECREDQLEIMEVRGSINSAAIKYRYNHNKYHESFIFSDGPKIKTRSDENRITSRWSGGPYIASNHILMNLGAWTYNLSGLIYSDNLGLFTGTERPYRWVVPTWTALYRAPSTLSDADGNNLLTEHKLSDFASYITELDYTTYRFGYNLTWRSSIFGVLVGLHYEWSRWTQSRNEAGMLPQHTTQSLVPNIEIRWLPLHLEFGYTYTFYLGAGLAYAYNLDYKYTGGLFDNWGYGEGNTPLKDAINHVWRWKATFGVSWGYASAFVAYERDINSVFNTEFLARDGTSPFAGWKSTLGTLGLGMTLSF